MKHILMACGTGICTSTLARDKVEHFLDENGFKGAYTVTQCKIADAPTLAATHDFLIAITMLSCALDIPYIDGVPFLTGKDASESEAQLLELMRS